MAWYDALGNLIGIGDDEEQTAPPVATATPPPATTTAPPVEAAPAATAPATVDPMADAIIPQSAGYAVQGGPALQTVEQVDQQTTNTNTFIGSNGEVYQEYQPEAADWQKVGPNQQQLAASSLSGTPTAYDPSTNIVTETVDTAPLQQVGPRTQAAADQLNSVRPASEPQAVAPESATRDKADTEAQLGFGYDETGNPLASIQKAPEDNLIDRYLPTDEFARAKQTSGWRLPWALVGAYGEWVSGAKERQVEFIGEQEYRNLTGQPNQFVDGSLLDKAGAIGANAVQFAADSLGAQLLHPRQWMTGPHYSKDDDNSYTASYTGWLKDPDNAETVKQVYEQGYGGYTEGRALWEYYQTETQNYVQKIGNEVFNDPLTYVTAAAGPAAKTASNLNKIGKPVSAGLRAAQIAIDPVGEGIPAAWRAAVKPAATTIGKAVTEFLPDAVGEAIVEIGQKVNPLAETRTSTNRRIASATEEAAQTLSKQLREMPGSGLNKPRMILEDDPAGIAYIDPVTSTRKVITPANEVAAVRELAQRLDEVSPSDYQAMLQTPTASGKTLYDVLFFNDHLPSGRSVKPIFDNMMPYRNPKGYERYVDHMIGRIDRYGQPVIDDLYRNAAQTFNRSALFTKLTDKQRVAFAAKKLDTIDDILTRGGFVDTDVARHTAFKNRVMTTAKEPAYRGKGLDRYLPRPAAKPFRFSTPRPAPLRAMNWADGVILEKPEMDLLETVTTLSGTKAMPVEVGQQVLDVQRELADARGLVSLTTPLTKAQQARLDTYLAKYGEKGFGIIKDPATFLSVTPDIEDRIAGKVARHGMEIKLGLRDANGMIARPEYYKFKALGIPFGKALERYDNASGALKATLLYNWANILPFTTKQWVGNGANLQLNMREGLSGFFSLSEAKKIYDREKDTLWSDVMTDVDQWRADRGLPISNTMRTSTRTGMATGGGDENLGLMSKIVAPERFRRFAQVSDLRMRETSFKAMVQPLDVELRQVIRTHADNLAGRMGVTVNRAQIDNALDALEGAASNGTNGYSPIALREALRNSGATGNVEAWAERAARDYLGGKPMDAATGFNGLRSINEIGIKEMERVGFSFRETRLDAVLNRVFFYHYWNSRASLLYARTIVGNPMLASAYYGITQALNKEAEENDYPKWLRGWVEFMATPAGFSVYADPTAPFNTAMVFASEEFQANGQDLRNLSGLGKAVDQSPFMTSPVLTSLLYWGGALGSDFTPPNLMGGYSATYRDAVELVNLFRTQTGRPMLDKSLFTEPNKVVSNHIANLLTSGMRKMGLDTNLVEVQNPNAGQQVKINWMVQQILQEQHPEWDASRVALEAAAIQDDDGHQVVIEANQRIATQPYLGLAPLDKGGPLGAVLGGLINTQVSPVPTTSQVTMKQNNQAMRGARAEGEHVPQTALDTAYLQNDVATSAGPEDIAFEQGVAGYRNVATPRQVQANDLYEAIQNGTVESYVEANGTTYSVADIKAMSEERRKDLAKVALYDAGLWGELQAMWNAKEKYREAHPEMTDYWAYEDAAKAYPGGVEEWAKKTASINPDFARYVADQERINPETKKPGKDRTDMLLSSDAYRLAYGMPTSIYESGQTGRDQGSYGGAIAGVPVGISPDQWKQVGGIPDEDGATTSSGGTDYQQAVQQDVNNFSAMMQIMNEYDASMGYAQGTSVQQYIGRVVNGKSGGRLDSALYDQIEEAFGYVFPSKPALKNYLAWLMDPEQNPSGVGDIQAFLDWDSLRRAREALGKPDVANMESSLTRDAVLNNRVLVRSADGSGFSFVPADQAPQGQVAQKADLVTPMETTMLLDPTNPYQTLGEIPPGLPLTLISKREGWALVQTPDGVQGWIPISSVAKAA